jgi:hypothetical protein
LEPVTIGFLVFEGLFWFLLSKYYYHLSVELSQYAQPPLKSSLARTAIVAIYGLGLSIPFILMCQNPNSQLPDTLRIGGNPSVLTVLAILLCIFSPIFTSLLMWVNLTGYVESILTPLGFAIALILALAFLLPFSYVLYETRKEIELRFQMATGGLPNKLSGGFKQHHVFHGKPAFCGLLGALSGVILFPWYVYFDLFKAKQGAIVYRKVTSPSYDWMPVSPEHPPPYVVRDERVTVDVGDDLTAMDEAVMKDSAIPLCPRCKKPLVFLDDQQKWWCKKCKRAAYNK